MSSRDDLEAPTTGQLRHSIDSGETGETVNFPDPAAVPLGADAEAGGAAPTAAERRAAPVQWPEGQPSPSAHRANASWPYWAVAGAIAVVLVLGIGWFAT